MKVSLHNLGCKTNAYETEAMKQTLIKAGFEIVGFEKTQYADVCIINTCSVTNIADRKSRQMIHKAKAMNSGVIVVATGCFVQTAAEEILKKEPVDICLGSNDKHLLVQSINEFIENKEKRIEISDLKNKVKYENLSISEKPLHIRAFIKIEDGCNQFCTFCIIPYARGRVRSRDFNDIIEEVKRLARKGIKEIVLTGINMSAYGSDFKEEKKDIGDVVLAIQKEEGIKRIRISSIEPQLITQDFLEKIKPAYKLCPHFHLSLQSGSDSVLMRMNRKYKTNDFTRKCELLRKYYKNPSITTDIIVGFPGETKEEFLETLHFIKEIRFFDTHIFQYSPRRGTPAAKMKEQISARDKKIRSAVLISESEKVTSEILLEQKGITSDVLIEENVFINNKKYYTGHNERYMKFFIESSNNDEDLTGKIVNAIVTDVREDKKSVFGRIQF